MASVKLETSVLDALKLMSKFGIGAVVIVDQESLIGVVIERDHDKK